jgi:hypothetical protein
MPENGRLSKEENDAAWATGMVRVMDAKMSCPQTLHITLFFDGTNNNDAEDNFWRDSKKKTRTNVARLYNAALDRPDDFQVLHSRRRHPVPADWRATLYVDGQGNGKGLQRALRVGLHPCTERGVFRHCLR